MAELGFGLSAQSLALVADAAHNFSDVIGLGLAWGAAYAARLSPTPRRTYGYRRASILAALANSALLFVAIGAIAVEAAQRLFAPTPIDAPVVLWVAAVGVIINVATALLFMRGRHEDLNAQGAFLHMAGDALVSIGVIAAALVIGWTGWLWLDPATSLVIAIIIAVASFDLARGSLDLALDAVPQAVDRAGVETYLRGLPGVAAVHDLHIWGMSTTETALTAHLVRPGAALDDPWLCDVADALEARFRIQHATLQVESGDHAHPCKLASDAVV